MDISRREFLVVSATTTCSAAWLGEAHAVYGAAVCHSQAGIGAALNSPSMRAREQVLRGSIGTVRHAYVEFVPALGTQRFDAIALTLYVTGLMETPVQVSVLGGHSGQREKGPSVPQHVIVTVHYAGGRSIVVAPSGQPRPGIVRGTSGAIELIGNADEQAGTSHWVDPIHNGPTIADYAAIELRAADILERAGAAWRTATCSPNRAA